MRLGVLDIGSNTGHLQLIDAHPGAKPLPYASHKHPLQLVTMLDADGAITEDGAATLVDFVREAQIFAKLHQADDVLAFCTSALREARNGTAVLEQIFEATGISMTELSGDQEAAATFEAVRRWYGWGAGTILNLDIGGGSLEIAAGQDELPTTAVSVPLGASRLTRQYLHQDPPLPSEIDQLREYVDQVLADAVKPFRKSKPDLVVGTSKTFRSLARLAGAAPSGQGPYVTRELDIYDLRIWTRRLGALSAAERSELPGISVLRSRQVFAGSFVALSVMEALDVKTLSICPWALREGLILRRFDALRFASGAASPTVGVGHVELGQRSEQE